MNEKTRQAFLQLNSHFKSLEDYYISDTKRQLMKQMKKGSKGEQITRLFLKRHNIIFEEQKRFTHCINGKTGRELPFDFYLPFYKCIIEIQGEQHFRPVDFSGHLTEQELQESFEEGQFRDNLKKEFCKKYNYKLFCINWDSNEKQLIKDLNEAIHKLKKSDEKSSDY